MRITFTDKLYDILFIRCKLNEKFLKYLKPLWKYAFSATNLRFIITLVQTKSESTCYINSNYTNVRKSFLRSHRT